MFQYLWSILHSNMIKSFIFDNSILFFNLIMRIKCNNFLDSLIYLPAWKLVRGLHKHCRIFSLKLRLSRPSTFSRIWASRCLKENIVFVHKQMPIGLLWVNSSHLQVRVIQYWTKCCLATCHYPISSSDVSDNN